ncbi:MAG TPA: hypothetical protein PLA81_10020, partial [Syntrophorhabdaceae bacterium]|nr:hypothetical protein [Syntrophorhabdaceae bacterium]
ITESVLTKIYILSNTIKKQTMRSEGFRKAKGSRIRGFKGSSGKRQKAEDRKQKSEVRRQREENRRQKSEVAYSASIRPLIPE